MIHFEYKTYSPTIPPTEKELNKYGAQGWALCAVDNGWYIFRRSKDRAFHPIKITDVSTDEVTFYTTISAAARALHTSDAALKYPLSHHTLYLQRYKVEESEEDEENSDESSI